MIFIDPLKKYAHTPISVSAMSLPFKKLSSAIGPRMMPYTTGAAEKPNLLPIYISVPRLNMTITSAKLF